MGQVDSQVSAYDPALAEISLEGEADDEIALIARLTDSDTLPEGVKIVTRFGDIVTLRVSRARIRELTECETVTAVEAPRRLRRSEEYDEDFGREDFVDRSPARNNYVPDDGFGPYTRRPAGLTATGKGVVIGVLDWGCDFAHPAFRHADGSTRLLAIWDQRDSENAGGAPPRGYGRVFDAAAINRALRASDPYAALNYHPADAGGRAGAHGTHVMDIAAGCDPENGMSGVAPEADLVFVHLSRTTQVLGKGNLGDSATVLEALDFVFSTAGDRPCVVNMSVGAHGGPHDGTALLVQGIDRVISLQDGRAVVNSAGNYFNKRAHAEGRALPSGEKLLPFRVPQDDPTESEIEVWYPGADSLFVEVFGPDATRLAAVAPGQDSPLVIADREMGHVYHYVRESLNGDHHVDLFLKPFVPGGIWALRFTGESVRDGRFHAWIERDRGLQPKFLRPDVSANYTTGTLCNGRLSITVGAYDPYDRRATIGLFSSAGPTRDGRVKPELVAPGVRIRAARSAAYGEPPHAGYVEKSGTSMAAPHVTGAVALLFEAAGRPLPIVDTRARLFSSTKRSLLESGSLAPADLHREGYGYLDLVAVEDAGRDEGAGQEIAGAADAAALMRPEQDEREGDYDMQDDRYDAEADNSWTYDTAGADWDVNEWAAEAQTADADADADAALPQEEWIDREDFVGGDSDGDQYQIPDQDVEVDFGAEESVRARQASEAVDWLSASRGAVSLGPGAHDADELPELAYDETYVGTAAARTPVDVGLGAAEGSVRAGDVLERSAPFEGIHYSAVVLSEVPEDFEDIAARGVLVEWSGPGAYVEVLETPIDGGSERTVGRKLTDRWGRMPPGQTVQSYQAATDSYEETVSVDDIDSEMNGLRCRFDSLYRASGTGSSVRTFSAGVLLPIENWNGTDPEAVIAGFRVPKVVLSPAPQTATGMRRYDVTLDAQRTAVVRSARELAQWLARESQYRTNRGFWERQRDQLQSSLAHRRTTYSRMWVRQMMYNRFDVAIVFWVNHYNRSLRPGVALDPNIVKSIIYQESRMGTSGSHLILPPYDWSNGARHPIKSRFNIGQAIDSWGPQQWLMMQEMAPAIFTRYRLNDLDRTWHSMSSSEYWAHPTFRTALREFFEFRDGSGQNLMHSAGRDLYEDYGFWIRTAIRWLFVKFQGLRTPSWAEAARAYNGGGSRARRYQREVMARVGSTEPYAAESAQSEAGAPAQNFVVADSSFLPEATPRLDTSAQLTWVDLTRVTDSSGAQRVFYVVTGAPRSIAQAGDEGKAVFHLRVRNTNSVYNHQDVTTKVRLLDILPARQFQQVRPWRSFSGRELEDESSRVIKYSYDRQALLDAYRPDSPLTRIEVEYHWREAGESAQRHYNRTGLDFILVAPIEYMFRSERRIMPQYLPLNNAALHRADYWIFVGGVDFTPDIRTPLTVQLDVTSTVSSSATGQQTASSRQTRSTTRSTSTSNTFSAQISGELSQGGSAKASVEILEVGVQRMMKLGASLGYSRTRTDTSSTTVANEFAQSLMYSRTYASSQARSTRLTLAISPPQASLPPTTGGGQRSGGIVSVGVYLYPLIEFVEVPYVAFRGVNALGQASERRNGRVAVPFVREWRLTSHRGP